MALSDITRDAVLAAMSEYDRLGQDEFLATYGFQGARAYRLIHNGTPYDSKAIVGVAHGYLPGDRRPLRADEFSGGEATVGRLLRRLGFTVEREPFVGTERSRPDIVHEEEPRPRRSRSGYVLSDYLDPKPENARPQFRSLLERTPVSKGKRQGDFLPVETLLCAAASSVVYRRGYGGANAARAPEPVPSLARLFKRSPESILLKMANLDNAQAHGGGWDAEVGSRLGADPLRLAHVYQVLLQSARAEGIGPDRLPDFLDSVHTGELLGQEEIGPAELEQAVVETEVEAGEHIDSATERTLAATVRLRQDLFARKVRDNCGDRCVFCGFSAVAFAGRRMLFAGHIKPWRDSTPRERLDYRNGLAACPTHDAAFDTGLITVDENLAIRVSGMLAAAIDADPTVRQYFGRPPLFETLQLPPGADKPSPEYLAWHRQFIFDRGQEQPLFTLA